VNVYTYYQPESLWNDLPLIDLWKKSWSSKGWNPIVLNQDVAQNHQEFDRICHKLRKLPSRNPGNYDFHCYVRHIGMAYVGGGLLTDYDVMNYSLEPQSFTEDVLFLDRGRVPCAIWGTAYGFQRVVSVFLAHEVEPGTEHVSDMLLCQTMTKSPIHQLSLEYLDDGWESSPLVHFPSAKLQRSIKHIKIEKIKKPY
jgi:hypothetical protein